MKEKQLNNISVEEAVAELAKHRNKILEEFSKAYLAESGLLPSQVELVHKITTEKDIITDIFYFRKKADYGQ